MGETKILQDDFFMDRNELQASVRAVMLDRPVPQARNEPPGVQATPESVHPTVQAIEQDD